MIVVGLYILTNTRTALFARTAGITASSAMVVIGLYLPTSSRAALFACTADITAGSTVTIVGLEISASSSATPFVGAAGFGASAAEIYIGLQIHALAVTDNFVAIVTLTSSRRACGTGRADIATTSTMGRIGGEFHTLAIAIGFPRLTKNTAGSCDAYFPGAARFCTGAAVLCVVVQVFARATTVGLARWAGANAVLTRFTTRAGRATRTAVFVVGLQVEAGSTTGLLSRGAGQ